MSRLALKNGKIYVERGVFAQAVLMENGRVTAVGDNEDIADLAEDARIIDGKTLYNYWGYNTVSFFSPNTSYSAEVEYNREGNELKKLIRVLHENGIEVILDVVFNHTAEGNEQGPVFSL